MAIEKPSILPHGGDPSTTFPTQASSTGQHRSGPQNPTGLARSLKRTSHFVQCFFYAAHKSRDPLSDNASLICGSHSAYPSPIMGIVLVLEMATDLLLTEIA